MVVVSRSHPDSARPPLLSHPDRWVLVVRGERSLVHSRGLLIRPFEGEGLVSLIFDWNRGEGLGRTYQIPPQHLMQAFDLALDYGPETILPHLSS